MPPLPLLYLLQLLLFLLLPAAAPSPPPRGSARPCAPFLSTPPFPFHFGDGCRHPSFQIRCSANRSHIAIKNTTFLVLDRRGNNSLLLAPAAAVLARSHCLSVPPAPFDLSGTPFRFSDQSCSDVLSLPPTDCSADAACSGIPPSGLTQSQQHLLSDPARLLKGCRRGGRNADDARRPIPSPGCSDAVAAVVKFLRSGVTVEWEPVDGNYFANCSSCQASCRLNVSESSKAATVGDTHRPKKMNRVILIGMMLFAFVCLFVLVVSAATVFRRNGSAGDDTAEDPMTAFLRRHRLQLRSPVYSYEQLRASTNGFDPKRKIGDGGFGSVYLANLDDGRVAAVKRLHRQHPNTTSKSFCNEILILSSIHHPNLVRLHGYCCDPRGLLLVYDYVPNGTLADHLHGSRSRYKKVALMWPVRVEVALQTASALEYLHFSVKPPVVHRDITSTNIFVEKDMRIKVGDFGLSRLLSLPADSSNPAGGVGTSSSEFVCTGPQGTPGYLDPDYHRSFRLTEKSDVYSFGVVLLELITGMKAVDVRRDKREVGLADMVVSKIQIGELHEVVDPVIVRQGKWMGTVEAVAELAFRCLAEDKDDRPDAKELVEELKRIRSTITDATSK